MQPYASSISRWDSQKEHAPRLLLQDSVPLSQQASHTATSICTSLAQLRECAKLMGHTAMFQVSLCCQNEVGAKELGVENFNDTSYTRQFDTRAMDAFIPPATHCKAISAGRSLDKQHNR